MKAPNISEGEWIVEEEGMPGASTIYIECATGTVAEVGPLGPEKDDEDRANAKFIAASKRMAVSLERILDGSPNREDDNYLSWADMKDVAAQALLDAGYAEGDE